MNALAGTGRLIRLALRRDRFVLTAWILALTVFLAMTTNMSVQGLPTQRDVVTETQFMAANPGMRLMSLSAGASVGAYAMSRSYLTLAILVAVMSTLAVVRHTRQSEETRPRRAPPRGGRRAFRRAWPRPSPSRWRRTSCWRRCSAWR